MAPGEVMDLPSVPFQDNPSENEPDEDEPFLAVAISAHSPIGPLTVVVGRSLESATRPPER